MQRGPQAVLPPCWDVLAMDMGNPPESNTLGSTVMSPVWRLKLGYLPKKRYSAIQIGDRAGFDPVLKKRRHCYLLPPSPLPHHLDQPSSTLGSMAMNVFLPQVTEVQFSGNLLETRQSPGRVSLT